ncbi:hypothetical protein ES708_14718 [subsurface metagenome]
MSKILIFLISLLLVSCNGINSKVDLTYQNPLPVKFGDPYILLASDGKYYMYGTGGGAIDGFSAYSSENFIDWKHEGQVYKGNTQESWTLANFWAPEVYENKGKYYMFFSADWKHNPNNELENFRIGVAVADKPTGPFKEISKMGIRKIIHFSSIYVQSSDN